MLRRFEFRLTCPRFAALVEPTDRGKTPTVAHVVRAPSMEAAQERIRRAYPNRTFVNVEVRELPQINGAPA